MGLYVVKDRNRTVVSRTVLRVPDGRRVRRPWGALIEERVPSHQSWVDPRPLMVGLIGLPPVVAALAALQYLGPVEAIFAAGLVLLVTCSVVPWLFRRRSRGFPRPGADGALELTAGAERTAFDRAVATADRVARTWPALDGLVDRPEAETLLAEALWEIAGVLARRQELTAVLAELSRPDFAALSPADGIAAKLQTQIRATKEALSAVEIDLAGREASLWRAEEAGSTFIREREMRDAIRAAERSLAAAPPDPEPAAQGTPDPAADLAEHTNLVLAAYRELTTALHPEDGP